MSTTLTRNTILKKVKLFKDNIQKIINKFTRMHNFNSFGAIGYLAFMLLCLSCFYSALHRQFSFVETREPMMNPTGSEILFQVLYQPAKSGQLQQWQWQLISYSFKQIFLIIWIKHFPFKKHFHFSVCGCSSGSNNLNLHLKIEFFKKSRARKIFKIFCSSSLTIVALFMTLEQVFFQLFFKLPWHVLPYQGS